MYSWHHVFHVFHVFFKPFDLLRALFFEVWYTLYALNTSVVLCGSFGSVRNLRTPALSLLRMFSRNLKQRWQSKSPCPSGSPDARRDFARRLERDHGRLKTRAVEPTQQLPERELRAADTARGDEVEHARHRGAIVAVFLTGGTAELYN